MLSFYICIFVNFGSMMGVVITVVPVAYSVLVSWLYRTCTPTVDISRE